MPRPSRSVGVIVPREERKTLRLVQQPGAVQLSPESARVFDAAAKDLAYALGWQAAEEWIMKQQNAKDVAS